MSGSEAYISKEQFYQIAHIRKDTARRLLASGLVPAVDTGKKTGRYRIRREDVEFYLKDRERDPEKYAGEVKKFIQTFPEKLKPGEAKRLALRAAEEWSAEPELLTAVRVRELLGYSDGTIRRWYLEGHLRVLRIGNRVVIPKRALLQFMMTPFFHSIRRKSRRHVELLRRSYYEGT